MTTIDDPEDEPTDPKIKETIEKIISFSDRLKSGIREGETWLDFQWAAELIRERLDLSPGKARQTLRELCGSGDVRAIICTEEERPISPDEWAKEALDLRPGYAVEVSMWDLAYWLDVDLADQQEPANAETDGRSSKKRELALQAIKALWPEGIPEIPNGEIEKQVGNWITNYCKQNNTRRLEISRDTILRVAGRK